jgi:hypothetical protein
MHPSKAAPPSGLRPPLRGWRIREALAGLPPQERDHSLCGLAAARPWRRADERHGLQVPRSQSPHFAAGRRRPHPTLHRNCATAGPAPSPPRVQVQGPVVTTARRFGAPCTGAGLSPPPLVPAPHGPSGQYCWAGGPGPFPTSDCEPAGHIA